MKPSVVESHNRSPCLWPSVEAQDPCADGAAAVRAHCAVLQGGGALGAYQAGVYEALAEADLHPDWVSGISIGAVNAAIIAGNPPEKRVQQLRAFWETVSQPAFGVSIFPASTSTASTCTPPSTS